MSIAITGDGLWSLDDLQRSTCIGLAQPARIHLYARQPLLQRLLAVGCQHFGLVQKAVSTTDFEKNRALHLNYSAAESNYNHSTEL